MEDTKPPRGYEALRYLDDEVVFIHDEARNMVFVSPSVENVLGYTEDAFKARRTFELIHPEDLAQAVETGRALRAEPGASYRSLLRIRHAEGHYVWCEIVGRNLLHEGVQGVVNTLRDVSDRRAREERLHFQAMHDELTGLPNRRSFLEHLDRELAHTGGVGIGVLILDLDGFKSVNDQFGHPAGDELLRRCGDEIARALRAGDMAARLGGDEFAVLGRRLESIDALVVAAERIRARASRLSVDGPGRGRVTASIGAALATSGDDSSSLLRAADEALYVAKRRGRDRVEAAAR